jgi:hypothetical protein
MEYEYESRFTMSSWIITIILCVVGGYILGRWSVPINQRTVVYSIAQEEKDCIAKEGELKWDYRSSMDNFGLYHLSGFFCVRKEKII